MSDRAQKASKVAYIFGLILITGTNFSYECGIGRRFGHALNSQLDIEAHYPNVPETSELASGSYVKQLLKNDTLLRMTINTQIIYQHHRLDSESRLATVVRNLICLLINFFFTQTVAVKLVIFINFSNFIY